MLSATRIWLSIGILVMAVKDSYGGAIDGHGAHYYDAPGDSVTTTTLPPIVISSLSTVTLQETVETCSTTTTTVLTTTTAPTTETVPTTITTTTPTTTTVPTTKTVPTTITVFFTTTVFSTSTLTVTTPATATVFTTTTIPTTMTITETFTTFPLRTSYTTLTVYDPCPSSCSIFAGTVNLIYWPTDKPHSYPATYVDTSRDYIFTSPSVYMLINTMYGTNSRGRVGPEASSTIWAFDLDEVSTLVLPEETATRQLYWSDLGTDCPQTLPASAIATKKLELRCDPVLLAPSAIRSWAWPCNACGPFGLFDPPYAIPTLDGGLLGTTTVVPAPTGPIPTLLPTTTPTPNSTEASPTSEEPPVPTTTVPTIISPTTTAVPTTISSTLPQSSAGSSDPAVVSAAARLTGGTVCLNICTIVLVLLFA